MKDNDRLSQQKTDALLDVGEPTSNKEVHEFLTDMETDTIGEIGNISFGSAATTLSKLLKQKVEITAPSVSVVEHDQLSDEFPDPYVGIFVDYTEGFKGSNVLIIRTGDAKVIADLMLGRDSSETTEGISEMELSAVQEAMNQMMGSASTSMSSIFHKKIDISPPSVGIVDFQTGEGIGNFPSGEQLIKVSFTMKVGSVINSTIMQWLPVDFAKQWVKDLVPQSQQLESAPSQESLEENLQSSSSEQKNMPPKSTPQPVSPSAENQHLGSTLRAHENKADIQAAMFSDFKDQEAFKPESQNLDMLFDIPLQVTVELGRTQRTVKDILHMSPGSVVELNKLAGEPVDIYVNTKRIAKGEVVVIDENFGVRVTEISSQSERIENLR